MPHGDCTGPAGMGTMSGRSAGFCAGYNIPGFANAGPGRGIGRGFHGHGRGNRKRFFQRIPANYAPVPTPGYYDEPYPEQPTVKQELAALEYEKKSLLIAMENLEKRISELENSEK